ncbi:MAG: chemotaxis protein CheB [Spirochaetales bacterium]|nr:chemotaxis protein CheB [Spirochaetales bacterium]
MDEKLLICLGGSAGSAPVLELIFRHLPKKLTVPLVVVRHMQESSPSVGISDIYRENYGIPFLVPFDKQPVEAGAVYLAPPGYHLLVEDRGIFALSVDERVNYSRPSVDVLFEAAAHSYGRGLLAVVLSGANGDGGAGMEEVLRQGGRGIAQDPESADYPQMPQAALRAGSVEVLSPGEIAVLIGNVQQERSLYV